MFIAWCIFGSVILIAIIGGALARGGKVLRDIERSDQHGWRR